jgi:pentose-5-phosphate-3-epimerase
MEIIPAILPRDFAEIEEKVELIKGLCPLVQIDICDGKFVTSTTWPQTQRPKLFQ